jgi:hypothetical protein
MGWGKGWRLGEVGESLLEEEKTVNCREQNGAGQHNGRGLEAYGVQAEFR